MSQTITPLPDGLAVLRAEMELGEIMRLIERTARWVDPETLRLLPVWNPEHARRAYFYKGKWAEPLLNKSRQTGHTEHKREGNLYANKSLTNALGLRWTIAPIGPAAISGASMIRSGGAQAGAIAAIQHETYFQQMRSTIIGNRERSDKSMGELDTITFGGSDILLGLVLEGKKTATCWAARHGQLSHVGKRVAVCDSAGRPRAILETTSLEFRRFCDVDEGFARMEGEGDLSLSWWRQAHREFFEREGDFSEDMELWCEQFHVVRVLSLDG